MGQLLYEAEVEEELAQTVQVVVHSILMLDISHHNHNPRGHVKRLKTTEIRASGFVVLAHSLIREKVVIVLVSRENRANGVTIVIETTCRTESPVGQ